MNGITIKMNSSLQSIVEQSGIIEPLSADTFPTDQYVQQSTNDNVTVDALNVSDEYEYEYYYYYTYEGDDLYYSEYLNSYSEKYKSLHGYISIFLCIFGILGNTINIVVFTRKRMISPTNVILAALATSDMLRILLYIPYTCIYYLPVQLDSQVLAYTDIVCTNTIYVAECASVWLTVMLTVWRFIAMYYPLSAGCILTMRRTKYMVIAVYCCSVCACIPLFFSRSVQWDEANNTYSVYWSELSRQSRPLEMFIYWFSALIMDILPCTLVSGFTLALIRVLHQAKSHRRKLTASTENDSDWRRINKMLLAILLLFLFSELPNGILTVLSDILGYSFYDNIQLKLEETLDVLELINHSVNCTIYYTMISKYREILHSMFNCDICGKALRKASSSNWLRSTSQVYHVDSTLSVNNAPSTSPLPKVHGKSYAQRVESAL